MAKATFRYVEMAECDVCRRGLEEMSDPYELAIGEQKFALCDVCTPNVQRILQAAGVETEGYSMAPAPARRPAWRV